MRKLFVSSATIAIALVATPVFAQSSDLDDFVHKIYMRGVPYDEAIRFDPGETVPALLMMLNDPKEKEHWPNVVIMLGMLGDERAIEPLIEFLENDPGEKLTRAHFIAKTGVVMALGYSIHRNENKRALRYLIDSASPGAWGERKITWISPHHPHADGRNEQLSKMSILGLALSGHPVARTTLVALGKNTNPKGDGKFHARVNGVIVEALKAHDIIAADGLVQYIEKSRAH